MIPLPRGGTRVAEVNFHIDTGADVTLLGRGVFAGELALTDADTLPGLPSIGVTGTSASRIVAGYLVLDHTDGHRSMVSTLDVSLLGLDLILAGELTLNAREVRFELD